MPPDVRRYFSLGSWRNRDVVRDEHARRLLYAMPVEQWYVVTTVLEPAFSHTDHDSVVHQKLVPQNGMRAVLAHEELVVEREITQVELQSAHTVVLKPATVAHFNHDLHRLQSRSELLRYTVVEVRREH